MVARGHLLVDRVRHDRRSHRELHWRGVDNAHDVAGSGGLKDAEERPVEAVLGVELDDLLVVVRALEELDAGVKRTTVGLEEDLDRVDERVERVGAERAALNGRGGSEAIGRRVLDVVGVHVSGERELELADVADGDRVRAAGGVDHGAEGAELAVLDVDPHLARGVVRAVPELNVRVERAALGGEDDLHLLHERGAVRPGAERAALHEDGGVVDGRAAGAGHGHRVRRRGRLERREVLGGGTIQVVCTLQLSGAGPASGETRGWLEGTRGVDPECEEAEDCA
mmetsp:Transcript_10707/g.28573  ORF Transcript_10707/g.28573 Transcript_10707/m.28573 type:complete len:283 (-) Transcript_10707:147-995(-)